MRLLTQLKSLVKSVYINTKNKKRLISVSKDSIVSLKNSYEGANYIGSGTTFIGNMGYASYIGSDSYIIGNIGRYTSIASNVLCVSGKHPTNIFVSTHPAFYSTQTCIVSYVSKNKFNEHNTIEGGGVCFNR